MINEMKNSRSSDLLPMFYDCKYFSLKNKKKTRHIWRISQVMAMVYCMDPSASSLSFLMSFDFESSVDVSYFWCMKLWQWLYRLVLNVCSVRPIYE